MIYLMSADMIAALERVPGVYGSKDKRKAALVGRMQPGDVVIHSTGPILTAEPNEPVEYRIERKR